MNEKTKQTMYLSASYVHDGEEEATTRLSYVKALSQVRELLIEASKRRRTAIEMGEGKRVAIEASVKESR